MWRRAEDLKWSPGALRTPQTRGQKKVPFPVTRWFWSNGWLIIQASRDYNYREPETPWARSLVMRPLCPTVSKALERPKKQMQGTRRWSFRGQRSWILRDNCRDVLSLRRKPDCDMSAWKEGRYGHTIGRILFSLAVWRYRTGGRFKGW